MTERGHYHHMITLIVRVLMLHYRYYMSLLFSISVLVYVPVHMIYVLVETDSKGLHALLTIKA